MATCKNCSKPIEVKQGRRPREFCDNKQKCRNEYFRKKKKEATHKIIPIDEYEKLRLYAKAGGYNDYVKVDFKSQTKVQDATKPTNVGQQKVFPPSDKEIKAAAAERNHAQEEKKDLSEKKHPLYKEGDPKENTMAFFLKYGVNSYDEIK